MSTQILFSWLGNTDIKASKGELDRSLGPIGEIILREKFAKVIILSNQSGRDEEVFRDWLRKKTKVDVYLEQAKLKRPTDYEGIYLAASKVLESYSKAGDFSEIRRFYNLTSGTPAMAAIWLLLAKSKYPGKLVEVSREEGVRTVSVPLDIYAELRLSQEEISDFDAVKYPEFDKIIHCCNSMKRLIRRAQSIAKYDINVLILGESGTGKELFARAIHAASDRRRKPFVAVNCGAIPKELIESEFFGYAKGAFTGADRNKKGFMECANKGILFLDEVGELPLSAQVKLLRALQDGNIQRVGATAPVKVDVRIIAATNRNLMEEVTKGNFREDFFYRLAVAVLQIPPLRKRDGDIDLLIDSFLKEINENYFKTESIHKKLSHGARKLLCQYHWPGNVRELRYTLLRAAITTRNTIITEYDVQEAIFSCAVPHSRGDTVLNRSLGNGFDIRKVVGEVMHHYLSRALQEAGGKKTVAAKLLGLQNYQTFDNWCKKYKVAEEL